MSLQNIQERPAGRQLETGTDSGMAVESSATSLAGTDANERSR